MEDKPQLEILPFDGLTARQLHAIYRVRSEVFVVGQGICCVSDVDEDDLQAWHVLLQVDEQVVGTARLIVKQAATGYEGDVPGVGAEVVKVGRVAVLEAYRGQGLGRALMVATQNWIGKRQGKMSAQASLRGWYESLGWQAVGEVYEEAGIEHIEMVLAPDRPTPRDV